MQYIGVLKRHSYREKREASFESDSTICTHKVFNFLAMRIEIDIFIRKIRERTELVHIFYILKADQN